MNFLDQMSDEFQYYSERGEKLKIFYNLDDFLNNEETKKILVDEWKTVFRKTVEEPLIKIIEEEKKEQENLGTPVFRNDRGGQFEGELIGELFHYIKPRYDLEIFYNNPELAKKFQTN